jgi:uncharacterized protein
MKSNTNDIKKLQMKRRILHISIAEATIIMLFFLIVGCQKAPVKDESDIVSVPFTDVKMNDQFWLPRIETNHEVTIPIAIEQSTITGRIKNFEIAGGLAEGSFCSTLPFDDSDVFKIIEAASYSMQTRPDAHMDAVIDTLIYKVAMAQEDDGYLYTIRTIDGDNSHPWTGTRWEKVNELSHELYNLGHLFEAAAAHFQATGKKSFLDVAIKAADMVDREFGWGKREDFPGHQEVELGLIRLYHVTGEKRYLDLAKFFLDVRGKVPGGGEYSQSHLPVIEQTEAVGHAVRATYMYAAMADVAALYHDESYNKANRAIWHDMVATKTYVTGGIGASGGNEGFNGPYNLPNMSAYCETCASIGNAMWNHRMFLADGDAKYYDVLERTTYNALLSGVSLSGDRFFYPNVLESMGQHKRGQWFGCACCPPNIARFLPSFPGYIYAKSENSIFVNMFAQNTANIEIKGQNIEISQKTNYPWEGKVEITLTPEKTEIFTLKIRIPGWTENEAMPNDLYTFISPAKETVKATINGKKVKVETQNGYLSLNRKWKQGDVVTIDLPMEMRLLKSDERIEGNRERVAMQRGPIVYCAEWPDNNNGHVLSLMFDKEPETETLFDAEMLNGVQLIRTSARQVTRNIDSTFNYAEPVPVTLIPYYAWNNRGPGEMMVWLPVSEKSVYPQPAPTIANRSSVSASTPSPALKVALTDQYEPLHSNDHTRPYYHWWPKNGTWEWVQYDFEGEETISSSKVYWYDDGPFGGCRIPADWKLEYKQGEKWLPVIPLSEYKISKDKWNLIQFKPVLTSAIRLKVKLPDVYSAGIHEWAVQ